MLAQVCVHSSSPVTVTDSLDPSRLETLLYFSRTYGERAVEIVDEAVNGGENWSVRHPSIVEYSSRANRCDIPI